MLDSRYLYLHEALGLGPMWLSQNAYFEATAQLSTTSECVIEQAKNNKTVNPRPFLPETIVEDICDTPATIANIIPPRPSKTDNRLNALQQILDNKTNVSKKTTYVAQSVDTSVTSNAEPQEQVLHFNEIPASIAACTRCSLHQERCGPLIGFGDVKARLLVISPNPAPLDDSSQQLFSGEVGKLLNNMLAAINIGSDEVFYTSQVKCTPNISLRITPEQLQACKPMLQAQIKYIQPQAILLLGEVFKQLEEKKQLTEFLPPNIPYVITPHPARLLRHSHLKVTAWAALKTLYSYLH